MLSTSKRFSGASNVNTLPGPNEYAYTNLSITEKPHVLHTKPSFATTRRHRGTSFDVKTVKPEDDGALGEELAAEWTAAEDEATALIGGKSSFSEGSQSRKPALGSRSLRFESPKPLTAMTAVHIGSTQVGDLASNARPAHPNVKRFGTTKRMDIGDQAKILGGFGTESQGPAAVSVPPPAAWNKKDSDDEYLKPIVPGEKDDYSHVYEMRPRATTAFPKRTRPLVSAQTGYNDVHNATTAFKSSGKLRSRSTLAKLSLDDENGPLVKALVAADEAAAGKDDIAEVTKKMQGTKLPSSPIQIEEPVAPPPTSSANTRQQLITASGRSNDMLVNVDNPGPGSFAIDKKSTLEKGTHNSRLQVGFVTSEAVQLAAEIDAEKVLQVAAEFKPKVTASFVSSAASLTELSGVKSTTASTASATPAPVASFSAPSAEETRLETLLFRSSRYPTLTGARPKPGRDAMTPVIPDLPSTASSSAFAAELLRLQYEGKDDAVALAIAAGMGGPSTAHLRKTLQSCGGKRLLTAAGSSIVSSSHEK